MSAGCQKHAPSRKESRETYLLFGALTSGLDTIAALDNICFEAYRSRSPVEFEEQAAGIAEDGTEFISSPEGRSRGRAILADRLYVATIGVSQRCSHGCLVG